MNNFRKCQIVALHYRLLSSNSAGGPVVKYRDLVSAGTIREDALQLKKLQSFQRLYDQLLGYTPSSVDNASKKVKGDEGGLWGNFFSSEKAPARPSGTASPKGLYVWGGVGCGCVRAIADCN